MYYGGFYSSYYSDYYMKYYSQKYFEESKIKKARAARDKQRSAFEKMASAPVGTPSAGLPKVEKDTD